MRLSKHNFYPPSKGESVIWKEGYSPIPFAPIDETRIAKRVTYTQACYETKNACYVVRQYADGKRVYLKNYNPVPVEKHYIHGAIEKQYNF